MPMMTAEEAAEWGKTLNFEKVWGALMELREFQAETSKQMRETDAQMRETDKKIAEMSKNLSGLGISLGNWSEEMFASNLCEKVNPLGYDFDRVGRNIKYRENGKVTAEVDAFLENGEYVMVVEIKVSLEIKDVNDHLARIKKVRENMDKRGDKRVIIGGIAGAVVSEKPRDYAYEKGLYVFVQTGDSVESADLPKGFEAGKW